MTEEIAAEEKGAPLIGLVSSCVVGGLIAGLFVFMLNVVTDLLGFLLPGDTFGPYIPLAAQLLTIAGAIAALNRPNVRGCLGRIEWFGKWDAFIWAAFFFMLVLLKIASWLTSQLFPMPQEPVTSHVALEIANGRLALILMSASVMAPLLEELLFRHAALSPALRFNRYCVFIVIILASALFSFAHTNYQHWTTYLSLFEMGLLLSAARVSTGGIALPIALHGASNAYIALKLMITS